MYFTTNVFRIIKIDGDIQRKHMKDRKTETLKEGVERKWEVGT